LDGALPQRYDVQPVDDYLVEAQQEVTRGVDVIGVMLLVFAAIALFVSVLVISNTFTVLLAQRQRDFALLRCVGATRRQVLRAVRLEALLVGAASSTLGLVVGALFGYGLVALAGAAFDDVPVGAVSLSPCGSAAAGCSACWSRWGRRCCPPGAAAGWHRWPRCGRTTPWSCAPARVAAGSRWQLWRSGSARRCCGTRSTPTTSCRCSPAASCRSSGSCCSAR
jgi:hypothetical protein